jgi:hypothetical protein
LPWKLEQPLWKSVWKVLNKLKIKLPYDPVISLLGTYLKECDPGYTCTPMIITALFTISKLWKKPRYQMNGLRKCGIHTIEYYSAIKKNEIMLFAGK